MDTPRTRETKKKIVSNLIMFPAHKARKPKTDLAKKQSEEEAKKITLDFIHVLQQNAVNMKGETILRDLAVVIESIKSLIKRDFKQKHPMQTITDVISKITTLPDGKKVTDMNYNKVFVSKTPPKVDK